MSLHTIKHFSRPLVLASAAVILHISAATAAGSTADTQQQIKELLAGTSSAHSAPQAAPRDGKVKTATADAQELIRQVLRGTSSSAASATDAIKTATVAGKSGKTEPQVPAVLYGDRQASTVRQVLLGQRLAKDAS